MTTPQKLGLAAPTAATAKPYRAACPVCGDFGTVLLAGATRQPRTMPEIMQHEAPCTCAAGDPWRALFDDFSRPLAAAEKARPTP